MQVVVGLDNPDYFEMRAMEFIQNAQLVARASASSDDSAIKAVNATQYHRDIQQAISLLALARIKRGALNESVEA